jgi:hypothetical protein
MKAMQIYIAEEDHQKLKQIYADTGQRITESVRQAIKEYLENEKRDNN